MCTEVSTVLRTVTADFFFNCSIRRPLRITVFGTYQGGSTTIRKDCDWKHSKVSMIEVEVVLQSCNP
jgi:hypothetical protein